MITWRRLIKPGLWVVCMIALFIGHHSAAARETGDASRHAPEVEVQLTESFYRALAEGDGKTYRTDRSQEYLRQIAISSKYMVETNLRVLENQRRIIELLESMRQPSAN